MSDVQPMTSTRQSDGTWEVIGTSHSVVLRKGIGGWWLIVEGEPVQKFSHKRAALQFCQAHPEL